MSALPPIADIHRLVPELLLQQKQRVLHPWAIFVADVWIELLFSSTVDRERTHTPDDPDSSYTCHKPLHRPLRHLRLHSMRADLLDD
jgi:hypothetical protein